MPIYEYECTGCASRFERWQKMHEEPVRTCPECGGATRRVLHPVGIIFKGSGFYVTDNRKPSTTSSSPAGKSEGTGDKSNFGDKATSSESVSTNGDSTGKTEAKVGAK